MMNKYGYFKYLDLAVGAKDTAVYSINAELQTGSNLEDLRIGVQPYEYASFEQNAYLTSEPKKIYNFQQGLGLLTSIISDERGNFENPLELVANFPAYHSMTGIAIHSRNIILNIEIIAYRDDIEVARGVFSALQNQQFYNIPIDLANKIVFVIRKINEPHHFFGIYNIEYGRTRTFDDVNSIEAEISSCFSVRGDKLEYDTLDLVVINPEKENYLFQRKQPLEFIKGENAQSAFYVDNGTENQNNTVRVVAYDFVSNLEEEFLGGIYTNYPFNDLLRDIIGTSGIEYETENTNDIVLSGYLPIQSRRKSLQDILIGSNIRCYKGKKVVFKPISTTLQEVTFNRSNILSNPAIIKNQEVRSVIVKKHNYSKGSGEETEAYNWYINTNEDVTITFSQPFHSLKAYEVTGVDSDGNDIVSSSESQNVTFLERSANYCIVRNTSSNKIVIKGKNYVDSTVNFKKTNPYLLASEIYGDQVIELKISSNPQVICDLLYELYSRKNSIRFKTLTKPKVGEMYSILGELLNINKIVESLDGLYEVEAM